MSHSNEQIYLLTIRGTLAPPSLEAARPVHNQTAGAPEGVAAAKSLGDLSHMVYVPVNKELAELFIMDLWTSPSGLNQFFSDPQVQQGAAMIFTQRDPVVAAGHLSHDVYFRLAQPGMPESLELFAIDGWSDLEGMNRYYDDPDFGHALGSLFTAQPATLLLKHPAGEWVEW